MKNYAIGAILGVAAIGLGAYLLIGQESGDVGVVAGDSACAEVCASAERACPSLVNGTLCASRCEKLSDETKEYLRNAESCESLTAKPELLAEVVIPEAETPKEVEVSSVCEAACANYVNRCLTLVPNATQALFEEGRSSCMSECVNWAESKAQCMTSAVECTQMTDTCGL